MEDSLKQLINKLIKQRLITKGRQFQLPIDIQMHMFGSCVLPRPHDTIHPPFWGLAGITEANGSSWN